MSDQTPQTGSAGKTSQAKSSGAFGMVKWVFKNFWFPILLFVLSRLGKKHEWAAKTHKTLKVFK